MYGTDSMPQTAENVAETYNITREEQDQFAFKVNMKAKKRWKQNVLKMK